MSVQNKQQQNRLIKDAITYLIRNTAITKCQPAIQKITKNKQQCRSAPTKQQCQSKRTTKQQTKIKFEQGTQQYNKVLKQLNQLYKKDYCYKDIYKFQSLPCTWKQPVVGKNYCTFSINGLSKRYFPNTF